VEDLFVSLTIDDRCDSQNKSYSSWSRRIKKRKDRRWTQWIFQNGSGWR